MKIQTFFIYCFIIIVFIQLWKKLYPHQQFIDTHCVLGQINMTAYKKKVVDCISCLTFPIQTFQNGEILITKGNPSKMIQNTKEKQSKIFVYAFMSKQCIEFDCADLQQVDQQFIDDGVLHVVDLQFYKKYPKIANTKFWQLTFPYDNCNYNITYINSTIDRLVTDLLDPILPVSWRPIMPFYSGMVLKIRYEQQLEQLQKIIIKKTENSEGLQERLIISLLVGFTLAVKLSLFTGNQNNNIRILVLGFGFVHPRLWSILSIAAMSIKDGYHVVSLVVYVIGLVVSRPYLVIISLIVSSLIEYAKNSKRINLFLLMLFNSCIYLSIYYEMEGVSNLALNLLYCFCLEVDSGYQEIDNKYSRRGIEQSYQEIDGTNLEDQH